MAPTSALLSFWLMKCPAVQLDVNLFSLDGVRACAQYSKLFKPNTIWYLFMFLVYLLLTLFTFL